MEEGDIDSGTDIALELLLKPDLGILRRITINTMIGFYSSYPHHPEGFSCEALALVYELQKQFPESEQDAASLTA
jgi:hypothetical protein